MLYSTLCMLLCCHFVVKTSGYFTDLGTLPTFSDWAIIPYTIATFGRVIYKENGSHHVKNTQRKLAPEGEQLEYFKTCLNTRRIYVDKSSFITEVLNDTNNVIRILRPRGWGKTMNLNMLEKFFEIEVDDKGDQIATGLKQNHQLFCGPASKQLQVCSNARTMSFLGKHPVISISLKGIQGNGYKEIEQGIRERLTATFQKHYYLKKHLDANSTLLPWNAMKDRILALMEGDPHPIDMMCSIQSLSELLYNHHGNSSRVYVLIDDFDSPLINAFSNFGHNKTEFQEVLDLMQGILSMGIPANEFVEKAIITGTYHFYMDDEAAGLENFTEYNLLNDVKYAKHFGFSRREVEDVLKITSIATPISEVEKWYGGYRVGGQVTTYNPESVMGFSLELGKFDQYSVQKANDSFVSKILSSDEVKTALKTALSKDLNITGDETDTEIDPTTNYISKSMVLLCNGIFTPTLIDLNKEVMKLKLPNEEVKQFVKKILE